MDTEVEVAYQRVMAEQQSMPPEEGKSKLEGILNAINEQFTAKGKLPWIVYQ